MPPLTVLQDYRDDDGNVVTGPRIETPHISITFRGRNNRLVVHPESRITRLSAVFHGDGNTVEIGHNRHRGKPQLSLRVGHGSAIRIGDDVSTTTLMFAAASEGSTIAVGRDVMCATHVQLRTDDSHGIYDVATGGRVNPARDIAIGDHVWLGYESIVLGGVTIGSGSVLGLRSIATRSIPNNCVAAGSPARIVRRDIAWERPYLWHSEGPAPWPDFDPARRPDHWRPTGDEH